MSNKLSIKYKIRVCCISGPFPIRDAPALVSRYVILLAGWSAVGGSDRGQLKSVSEAGCNLRKPNDNFLRC